MLQCHQCGVLWNLTTPGSISEPFDGSAVFAQIIKIECSKHRSFRIPKTCKIEAMKCFYADIFTTDQQKRFFLDMVNSTNKGFYQGLTTWPEALNFDLISK